MNKPTQSMFVEDDEAPRKPTRKKRQTKPKAEQPEKVEETVTADYGNVLELPSNGKLWYPSSVTYRDIMAGDEEVLASATPDTYVKTLNGVLKSLLNDDENYEKLSVFDRDYALVWLWANNYDSKKTVAIECHSCGHKETKTVDLTKVEVNDIKPNIPIPFQVPIKKANGEKVGVRLNTVEDEIKVDAYLAKHPTSSYELLMLYCSVDLGVNMAFEKKIEWARENISSKELGIIRQFHEYFKFGVNEVIEHSCSECGEVTRGPIPFQAEDVLFPTVSTDFDRLLRASEDNGDQSA